MTLDEIREFVKNRMVDDAWGYDIFMCEQEDIEKLLTAVAELMRERMVEVVQHAPTDRVITYEDGWGGMMTTSDGTGYAVGRSSTVDNLINQKATVRLMENAAAFDLHEESDD